MRNKIYVLLGIGLLGLSGCSSTNPVSKTAPVAGQMVKHLKIKKSQTVELNYLLFLPRDYEKKPTERWPLILFLHGAGERGSDIQKVATHGPPKNVRNQPDFPFIVVSPQCPDHQHWANDSLLVLLDEVLKKYSVDTGRIYLTGLSMGGYGTWSLGLAYPEKFAAIVPICGGGQMISVLLSSRDRGEALKRLGVWAFHGAKDPVVPVEESQRMIDALKKAAVQDVKLTIYPEATHDSWTQTYDNPELYQWMLKHERTGMVK